MHVYTDIVNVKYSPYLQCPQARWTASRARNLPNTFYALRCPHVARRRRAFTRYRITVQGSKEEAIAQRSRIANGENSRDKNERTDDAWLPVEKQSR